MSNNILTNDSLLLFDRGSRWFAICIVSSEVVLPAARWKDCDKPKSISEFVVIICGLFMLP